MVRFSSHRYVTTTATRENWIKLAKKYYNQKDIEIQGSLNLLEGNLEGNSTARCTIVLDNVWAERATILALPPYKSSEVARDTVMSNDIEKSYIDGIAATIDDFIDVVSKMEDFDIKLGIRFNEYCLPTFQQLICASRVIRKTEFLTRKLISYENSSIYLVLSDTKGIVITCTGIKRYTFPTLDFDDGFSDGIFPSDWNHQFKLWKAKFNLMNGATWNDPIICY